MKKLTSLGKALNKAEQKMINGGKKYCDSNFACPSGECCKNAASGQGYCGVPNQGPDLCYPI